MGPPHELIVALSRKAGGLKTFIETGTYTGGTASWAANVFELVVTIEASQEMYNRATATHANVKNIRFVFGDSRTIIGQLAPELPAPVMFWLDAHWSGGATWGDQDECPLLSEIESINRSAHTHYILIDDARLFLAPPPAPHNADHWPTIDRVTAALNAGPHRYYIVVFEDVIIAVPGSARDTVIEYCRTKMAAGR
jgi:hypothetical protein